MKIVILGTRGIPSGYSGYEAFAEELSVRLVERGNDVTIFAHRNMFPPNKRKKVFRGVKLRYIPSFKGKNSSQFSHSLLSTLLVLFFKIDIIIFCNAANGPFGLILKAFGKKTCINVDGLEWLRPKWGYMAKKYFYFGAWSATKFFDVVITDAKAMQNYYKKEFNCESIDIAYGADLEYTEKPELIEELGVVPGNYYLIASRLVPDNNADLIIEAFMKSESKKNLVIAGGVNYANSFVDNLIKNADPKRVMFLGHINNSEIIKELHTNAFIYIHGHEFGGTNPAIIKALAYGNAILALNTAFNREVLVDGEYGMLYNKDINDLTEKINLLENNDNLLLDFRNKSRDRIKSNYTWEKITEQYYQLFKEMYLNN